MRRGLRIIVGLLVVLVVALRFLPELLLFPNAAAVRGVTVYSTAPIPAQMDAVLARADALDAASPLAPIPSRRIFLTDGGWRWKILAIGAEGAFAVTRPLSGAIVINRNSVATDAVWNNAKVGGYRTLAGVIAHETVHLMINHRYGLAAITFPSWKVEGYADHVAHESSLSDTAVATLRRERLTAPGLAYYEARKRIEAMLAGGMTVDQVLRGR